MCINLGVLVLLLAMQKKNLYTYSFTCIYQRDFWLSQAMKG